MGIRKASKKDQPVEKSCPDTFFNAQIRNWLLPFPLSKLPNWLFWKQACSGWVAVGDVSVWVNLLRLFGSLLLSLTHYSCFFFKLISLSCPFGFAWFPLGSGLAVSSIPGNSSCRSGHAFPWLSSSLQAFLHKVCRRCLEARKWTANFSFQLPWVKC